MVFGFLIKLGCEVRSHELWRTGHFSTMLVLGRGVNCKVFLFVCVVVFSYVDSPVGGQSYDIAVAYCHESLVCGVV